MEAIRVLVVDDDAAVRRMLVDYLSSHGYEVREAASGAAMRSELERALPAVVLLDIGLPGDDDYIAKPFDPRELRARLKSVLRRLVSKPGKKPAGAVKIPVGRCLLDMKSRTLTDAKGREVAITAMEFELLRALIEHPNQVLSRDQLLTMTRNREWEPFDRSIDIRITRLRRKVEDDPAHPRAIKTVRGAGYMFIPSD